MGRSCTGPRARVRPRMVASSVLAVLLAGCTWTASDPDIDRPARSTASRTVDPAAVAAAVDLYLDDNYSPAIGQVRVVLVMVDGQPVAQRYRGGASASSSMDTHSVTKSVTATLVGIAVDEGLLTLDDRLVDLLPRHADVMSPAVQSITVRQLLTMTGGLAGDLPDGSVNPRPTTKDWVRELLAHGTVVPPGQRFSYSSTSSNLLAAILVEATGMPLMDYARPRLFDPLGIDTTGAALPRLATVDGDEGVWRAYDAASFGWLRDPTGVELGCCSLKMSAVDMAKLGQLYLQDGRWDGHELVPASWVRQATTAHVVGLPPAVLESYGYHWWVTTARGHPAFAAVGFGGQLVEVVPDLRLVVVTAAEVGDRVLAIPQMTNLVANVVIPAVGG